MSDFTPKVIHHPGVEGPLREQTLDEYLAPLTSDHLARRQLSELRRMATEGKQAEAKLALAQEELTELRGRWHTQETQESKPISEPSTDLVPPPAGPFVFPKVPCPYCDKVTSTSPGAWKMHMNSKHRDQVFQSPPV